TGRQGDVHGPTVSVRPRGALVNDVAQCDDAFVVRRAELDRGARRLQLGGGGQRGFAEDRGEALSVHVRGVLVHQRVEGLTGAGPYRSSPVLVACEGVARQSHQRRSLLEQLTELRLIPLAVQIRQRLKKLLVPHPILILSTAQRLNSQLPKKRVRSKIPGHPTPIHLQRPLPLRGLTQ